jgi:hypothetical protein
MIEITVTKVFTLSKSAPAHYDPSDASVALSMKRGPKALPMKKGTLMWDASGVVLMSHPHVVLSPTPRQPPSCVRRVRIVLRALKKPLLLQGITYRQHLSAVMSHRHTSLFLVQGAQLSSID